MNLSHSASGDEPIRLSEPLTIGMFPVPIHPFCSSLSSTALLKKFCAVVFSAAVAFEEIDRYWAGLPTVSLGSPFPPSTPGKFIQPRCPPVTKSPPLAFMLP
jgi:hypothetical protein